MTNNPSDKSAQLEGWEPVSFASWSGRQLGVPHYYRNGKSLCGKQTHRSQQLSQQAPKGAPCKKCQARSSASGFGVRGPRPGHITDAMREAAANRKWPRYSLHRSIVPAGSGGDNLPGVLPAKETKRRGIVPKRSVRDKRARSGIVPAARARGTKGRKPAKSNRGQKRRKGGKR